MRIAIAMVFVACGDSSAPGDPDAAMAPGPDVNIAQCDPIGRVCDVSCPSTLECVNNACVPVRGDCGGFAGAECQNTALVCTYPSGSSAGICMQPDEKECVCAIARAALGDCPLEIDR